MLTIILSIIAVIATALFAAYKYFTANHGYFKKLGIPYIDPNKMSAKNIAEYCQYLYESLAGERIGGFFIMRTPTFLVRDPEILKELTIKKFDHFENHRPSFTVEGDEFTGNSLFFLQGEKWRDMRSTLSPAFTGNKMRQMLDLIVEIADDMTQYMAKQIEKGVNPQWEVKDLVSRFTNDAIATSAFGVKVNSMEDPKNDFMLAGEQVRNISNPRALYKLLVIMFMPRLANLLRLTVTAPSTVKFFKPLVFNMIAEREKHNIFRPDMVNILMQVRKGTLEGDEAADEPASLLPKRVVKREWTDNELLAQALIFFGAGFNTVSDLISFAIYELALHPDIQQRLYEEIDDANQKLNGKPLNYDALKSLVYLDQVVSETLRKWPPAPIMDRECVKDFTLDVDGKKIEIKKGQSFNYLIYSFHHDPEYFPEPHVFDPERFSEENKENIVSGTYVPFGIGPRMCIGNRLALMESKAFLFYLLLRFKIEPNDKTDIPMKLQNSFVNLVPLNGIHVDFVPRT